MDGGGREAGIARVMHGGRASSPPQKPTRKPQSAGQAWIDGARDRPAARRLVAWGALVTVAACAQAWCLAALLAGAISGAVANVAPWAGAYLGLAVLRAAVGVITGRDAAAIGAGARRRLRSGVLAQMFAAGPDALRHRPAGAIATLAVDMVEQLDGLYARWTPAAALALVSPAIVLAALAWADLGAVPIVAGAGLLVPAGMALAGTKARIQPVRAVSLIGPDSPLAVS